MARPVPKVARELEARVERLGYELVDVGWAGSAHRPLLRIRIDRGSGSPGVEGTAGVDGKEGVTLEDCALVSRALEVWLDGTEAMPERYVLEVSSPGVDRPLRRAKDFERFVGKKVAVKGRASLAGRANRLEGELLGLDGSGTPEERVRLRLPGGDEVEIPRTEITGAHLVFEW